MAEQSFGIELRAGADVSEFRRELKAAQGDVEALAKVIDKFKRQAGDVATGQRALITLEGKDAASGAIGVVTDKLNKYGKEARETIGQLNKLTGAEKRSAMGLAQKLSYLKQAQSRVEKTSRSYRTLEKGIVAYTAAIRQNNGVQKGSIADLTEQANKLQRLSELYTLGSAEQVKYANAARKIRDEIKGTTSPLSKFFGVLNRIATVQAGFTAFAAIIGSATGSLNKFVGQQKALEGFELALKNVGLSTAEVNERLADAARISAELGAPLEQVEKSFKRMVPALEAVGVNAEDSGRFLEGIAARTQTLGLNTEQTGRFMEAFAQVLSKGKLQSEELNQQISELDGAFRGQLAKSLGVTTQQLEDMIKNGEITSKVFVKAFNDMANGADALRERIKSGNATIQQLQNLIDLIDTQNIRRIGKAIEPGIKAFLEIQVVVAEFIETVSKSQVGQLLATIFNEIAKGARDFVKAVTEVSKIIIALLEPIAGITNLFGGLIRVVTAATLAFVSYKTSLAITGLLKSVAASTGVLTVATGKLAGALGVLSASGAKVFFLGLKAAIAKVVVALIPLLAKLAPFLLLLGAAKLAMDAFRDVQEKTVKPAQQYASGLKEIVDELDDIVTKAKDAKDALDGLPDKPKKKLTGGAAGMMSGPNVASQETLNAINKNKLEMENLGFVIKRTDKIIDEFFKASKGGFKISGLSAEKNNKTLIALRNTMSDLVDSHQEKLDTLKKEAKEIDTTTAAGKEELKTNQDLQQTLMKQISTRGELLGRINEELSARGLNDKTIKQEIKSLKDLQNIQKAQKKVNDMVNTQLETAYMEKFGDSAKTAADKLIVLTAAQEKMAVQQRQNIKDQLEAVKAMEVSDAFSQEDKDTAITNLTSQLLEAEKLVRESNDRLNKAVQEELERTLGRVSKLADDYKQLADVISQGSAKLASSTTGALGDLRGLANAVFEREMQGASPQQQRDLEDKRLRMMARINELEHQIARVRLQTEARIAQLQNQQIQVRLSAEQKMAARRGDREGAADLGRQIQITKEIGVQQQKVFSMEMKRLDIQKRLKNEQLTQEAMQKGMFSQYTNRLFREEKIRKELGLQKTTVNDLVRTYKDIKKQGFMSIVVGDKKAIKTQEQALETQKTGITQVNERAKQLKKTNKELVESGAVFGTAFQNIESSLGGVNKEASKFSQSMRDTLGYISTMKNLVGGGTEARFMGGPVEGGQTYRVNDAGLGREAFMNKFGDVKMLPAASNMNWTAPSSGTIIPAKMVKAMQKNADINANISAKQTRQSPNISNIASSAASGVSGSLAKQLGSAVSGSTSNRITNNVTIQSQSPVNDASDLMTNVARMRLRNTRRI